MPQAFAGHWIRAGRSIALLGWLCAGMAIAQAPAMPGGHAMAAVPAAHPATWGEHGMVLFGGADGLFASHLPMFHAPHDYHVVIALRIADPALDAAMRQRLAAKPELWTLVPEDFELARLAPGAANPLTHFKADIVEGHFERGGRTIHAGVDMQVLRTERYVRLDPAAHAGTSVHYQPIGLGHTWFLVKEVRARPDFDQVVMLSAESTPGAIDVPVEGISKPADSALIARLPAQAKIVGTVYYDVEDLR